MDDLGMHFPAFVKGTCNSMCSRNEYNLRFREKLLHPFELNDSGTSGDPQRAVKVFSRPSAGQKPQEPSEVRTIFALKRTVNYLLNVILTKDSVGWAVVYDFIFDRLRAVRQDCIIQGIDVDCIEILEAITRFYSYAGYRLCEEPIEAYDPKINYYHLSQCLTWLLAMYDADSRQHKHRNDFEALNVTVNLGNIATLTRILSLTDVRKSPVVKLVYDLSLAVEQNNFVRTSRLMSKLPVWLACTAVLHLPEIRKKALRTMSVAYNSRNLKFPCSKLLEMLLYGSIENVTQDCKHFHLSVVDNSSIIFDKQAFNGTEKAVSARHEVFVDGLLGAVDFNHFQIALPKKAP